jgi:hypothetical protein
MTDHALTSEQWTRCEEALSRLDCASSTLHHLWDAIAHGACSCDRETAKAIYFIKLGIEREIDELQGLLGLKGETGGADA